MDLKDVIISIIQGSIGYTLITYFSGILPTVEGTFICIAPWGALGILLNKVKGTKKTNLLDFNKWAIIWTLTNLIFFIIYHLLLTYFYKNNKDYYQVLLSSLIYWFMVILLLLAIYVPHKFAYYYNWLY
tara:strand:+ start:692 stop:1078 length:387 start_codon:yes stop_codon:yes gene_type:complete